MPVNVVQEVLELADVVTTMTVDAHLVPNAFDVAREGAGAGFGLVQAECGQNTGEAHRLRGVVGFMRCDHAGQGANRTADFRYVSV